MRRFALKLVNLWIVIMLFGFVIVDMIQLPIVLGDVAVIEPPTSSGSSSGGGFVIDKDKNITFGNASVLINANVSNSSYDVFNYYFKITANFTIRNQGTRKNITLGFVYPESWQYKSSTSGNVLEYDIYINKTKIDSYGIVQGNKFNATYLYSLSRDATFVKTINTSKIVVFNATIAENTTISVSVNTNFMISTNAEIYRFEYIIATARAWNGNFREIINATITSPKYVSVNPYPVISMTQNDSPTQKIISWEIDRRNIENFTDCVGLEFVRPSSQSSQNRVDIEILRFFFIPFFLVYVVLIVLPLVLPPVGIIEYLLIFLFIHHLVSKRRKHAQDKEKITGNKAIELTDKENKIDS